MKTDPVQEAGPLDQPTDTPRLRYWQNRTVVMLFIGYAGYYVCRSNFAVVKPLLISQFASQGIDKESIGLIASIGTICYAIGKVGNTILCDFVGGKRMFVLGMIGSVLCTLLFGLTSGFAFFLVAWSLNRVVQSTGWGGLVKTTANWFPFGRYGSVMGILSLSFLLGDAVTRWGFGTLLNAGLGWRQIYFVAAAILLAIAVITMVCLKSGPRDVGELEPPTNPQTVYAEKGDQDRSESLRALLIPILRNASFWIVLMLSFGLTLVRETFNDWLPLYLKEIGHLKEGDSAQWAALFPLFGGVSVLAVGYASDRFSGGRRGGIMSAMLMLSVLTLFVMSRITRAESASIPIILAAAVALLTIGPYSFLGGAIALDLGGRQGSATASGMIDGAGYLGGVLSGYGVGALAQRSGWGTAFAVLAGTTLLTTLTAVFYWRFHERPHSVQQLL